MSWMNFKLANRYIFSHPNASHPITLHHIVLIIISTMKFRKKPAKIVISNAKILTFELKLYGMFVQWDEVMAFFALFSRHSPFQTINK